MALEFTDSNFEETVLGSGVAVADFWAEWCGPCRLLTPIIDDLHTEYEGKVRVGKVNVDDNPKAATDYGVRSIPTIIIFKDGEIVDKHVGTLTKAQLTEKIEAQLA